MDANSNSRIFESERLRAAWKARFGSTRGQRKILAQQYGVHESFIHALLAGDRSVSALWKVRMAQFLGMKPHEIWPDFNLAEQIGELVPEDVAALVKAALDANPDSIRAAVVLLENSKNP